MFEIYDFTSKQKQLADSITAEKKRIENAENEHRQKLECEATKQTAALKEQIELEKANYEKLDKLYILKSKEAEDNKVAYIKSRKYNILMLIISILSGVIAIASLLVAIFVK